MIGDLEIKKVVHLTSVHDRFDTRIFWKQCKSLVGAGYAVTLVVADGLGGDVVEGVSIVDVGAPRGRVDRIFGTSKKVLAAAKSLVADIYHIHDPELLLICNSLKQTRAKVVFDAHEDLPIQLLSKPYLGRISGKMLSYIAREYERSVCRKLDAVVTATPTIRDKFAEANPNTIDINNFPLESEFSEPIPWSDRANDIVYVGGITAIRGVREVIEGMHALDGVRLNLAGKFMETGFEQELTRLKNWQLVNRLGFLDRAGIQQVLGRSKIGMVTLHPVRNYVESLPVKLFEYMAAGIPVIASNFPIMKAIIDEWRCGLYVDPLNPEEISSAVSHILADQTEAEAMGRRGRKAVLSRYNWRCEGQKLIELYRELV